MTQTPTPEWPLPASSSSTPGDPNSAIRAIGVRHPGRWVVAAVLAVVAAMAVHAVAFNSRFGWNIVFRYFASKEILTGLLRTLELTSVAMGIGIVLGTVLAVMRLSPNPIVANAARLYVWFFRATPVLVQILLWFNLAALFPKLSIGIPFGARFASASVNSLISPFAAAILGLGLNEGAYMSEIVRAGVLSVDHGQVEAAQALGMRRILLMRRIVLPQAMRIIVPPTGNETISMLKTSSLVSVIALPELLYSAEIIYSRTYQTIPLLITASIWYAIVTTVLTFGQASVERHFAKGQARPSVRRGLFALRGSARTKLDPIPNERVQTTKNIREMAGG